MKKYHRTWRQIKEPRCRFVIRKYIMKKYSRHRGVPANVLKALEEELADVSRKEVEKKPAGAPDGVKKGTHHLHPSHYTPHNLSHTFAFTHTYDPPACSS